MSISVGDKIPAVSLKALAADGSSVDVTTEELFGGKKVVLFGVPGAFTGTCSKVHLPGYVAAASDLKGQGVDSIICMAVNDRFVMKAWQDQHDPEARVTMLGDGSAVFTKALGLDLDLSGGHLGVRCKRFSATVEDGVVKSLNIEPNPGEVVNSGAETCLTGL